MKPKPLEKKEGKIVDWLKEQRHKQSLEHINGGTSLSTKSYDW